MGAVVAADLGWAIVVAAGSAGRLWGPVGGVVATVLYCGASVGCLMTRGHAAWRLGGALVVGLWVCVFAVYASLPLLYLVVVVAPLRMRLGQAMTSTALAVCGFAFVGSTYWLPRGSVAGIGIGLVAAFLISALANQIGVTRRQLTEVARARADEAMLAERQRLAREVHDVLAHSLSAQIVHLEGTRLLLQLNKADAAQVLSRVTRAGELARDGLREARRAVVALRGDTAPMVGQLVGLVDEFRAVTGHRCTLAFTGDDNFRPEHAAASTVVRVAQEALSNVRRHAPGADVAIVLHRDRECLELDIRDSGPSRPRPPIASGGYGLAGMRERAELLGGRLHAGPDGAGFRVRLRIPT
ncbi:sensor histidine kinase [Saccharothrix violaceirubra]|uniref:histidine kinase n=1 Tax=Saccharothrix violaceirubra TaxID=413306 RepID=A0A7W7T5A8_9PSEU|nr:sensor histidine kinase [Saccharothrix violaceirubra]MBB4965565.1 signal transduction histidine kinase [Saccharothrix violaceirubra]